MKENDYISDFDDTAKQDYPISPAGPIDFSIATKLEGNTGSTCDVYVAQYHNTKVLVKKLKPHLKDKVLYKNALEKEFTLGFRLKHNGLPTYKEFHENYIIMEFVEGNTLLSLLQRKDPWLSREGNIRKLLIQLLDVLTYLHSNDITHCDIKADNIILTKGHHNVVLIDLDKTYTSYSPNSSGSISHFNIEESKVGHPDMDFHGVGKLVDLIIRTYPGLPVKKFRKFEAKCMGDNVSPDDLMELLEPSNYHNGGKSNKRGGGNNRFIGFGAILSILIILAILGVVLDSHERDSQKQTAPILNPIPEKESTQHVSDDTEVSVAKPIEEIPLNENERSSEKKKDSYKKEIESQMKSRVLPLLSAIQEGSVVFSNPNSTDEELREVVYNLFNIESDMTIKAYSDFETQFPQIGSVDVQMAVINSKSYKEVTKEAGELIQKITDEIVARNPESYSIEQKID